MGSLCTFLSSIAFLFTGARRTTTQSYKDVSPKLDIREYLNGQLEAWGIIYSITGKQDLAFHVKMKGSWQGNIGSLEEEFTYNDGRKDSRVWHFNFTDDHHFTATAHDVKGKGQGSQHGNAANLTYVLNARRGSGKSIVLSMDDWLYLMDEKTLINRTLMKKFGLAVAEMVVTFRKL